GPGAGAESSQHAGGAADAVFQQSPAERSAGEWDRPDGDADEVEGLSMRTFFGIDRRELILFVVCALGYAAIVFGWNLSGTADDPSMSFIRGTIPVIGDLPPQSVSKFVITVGLYLMALVYGLLEIATGPYRKSLPQIVGIGVLTFLAWTALNYWVIAGFLNTSIVYGVVAVVLLIVWFGGVLRFVSAQHDPMAAFLVRYGLGLSAFITIVQLIA